MSDPPFRARPPLPRSPIGWLRRLRNRLRGRTLRVWYHPSYRIPLSGVLARIGMGPRRADDTLTWLLDRGMVGSRQVHTPRKVGWIDVERVHPPRWIEQLDQHDTLARVIGIEVGSALPVSALLEMFRRATGGTVEAARWAVRHHGTAANLMGGFHHAHPERGIGFCPINDVAIAVQRLRYEGFQGSITVLDLDAHPPDGIATCLQADPQVHIASLGVASDWEAGPRVLDERLPPGAGDATYLERLDALLTKLQPGALTFYLAGADPMAGDRFGGLAASREGLRQRDRRVIRWLKGRPAVILPAGGYTEEAWKVLAGTLAEAAGSEEPVHPDYDPVHRRTLDIYRALDPERLTGDLEISFQDIAADLGGAPHQEPRFLGTYTRHGLEYALERYGLLPALRRMGFLHPQLELTCGEMPHRVRVLTPIHGRPEAVADLALSIKPFNGWRTLFIEWLELRDPRTPLSADAQRGRSALPGQRHPGLGLAAETAHLLLRTAERLALDAVALIPAWYHVAWMGRKDFEALDPEHQGRFEALLDLLAELPLHEATARLHGPGVQTAAGPIRWEPVPMVRPVSEAMRAQMLDQRPKVEEARERCRAQWGAHPL